MNLAVLIPTYQRTDGRTPFYLKRLLDSLCNQKFKGFEVVVIGDKYENENELFDLLIEYKNKISITCKNLEKAVEREKYEGEALFKTGGVNANNVGIDYIYDLFPYIDYIVHLDHDDLITENHLLNFVETIKETKADFLCSKAEYINGIVLPTTQKSEKYCDFLPDACQLIHSSICVNFRKIPIRYVDTIETQIGYPADAYLMIQLRNYIRNNNLKSVMINEVTIIHDEEGNNRKEL